MNPPPPPTSLHSSRPTNFITAPPPTSLHSLRSTDLPSLRTQSSMRVLRPAPHTALSLSWQVLQSAGIKRANLKHTFDDTASSIPALSLNRWYWPFKWTPQMLRSDQDPLMWSDSYYHD